MLPTDFVNQCKNQFVNVRLRNGDFYNGILDGCDFMMNFVLTNVTLQKNRSQEEITLDRAMIRGSSIQFISLPSNITDVVKKKREDVNRPLFTSGQFHKQRGQNNTNNRNYGGRGGYQRNRGRGGGSQNNNFVYTPSNNK